MSALIVQVAVARIPEPVPVVVHIVIVILVDNCGATPQIPIQVSWGIDRGLCFKDNGVYYFAISDCGSLGDCVDGPFLSAQTPTTGTEGDAYSWTPTSTGTNTPDTWDADDMPAGLSINPATGEISGTPTEVGEFLVVLTASKDACVATKIDH